VRREVVKLLEDPLGNIHLIERDIQLALDLGGRPLRVSQKLDKFCIAAAIEPFSDVVHHGTRSPLDLVFQSVIFGKLFAFRRFIHQMREISADLPCFDILKSLDFHFR